MRVNRLKHGAPSTHPPRGAELRALRRLQRDDLVSPCVFTTEREGLLKTSAVRRVVARAGEVAKIGVPVHPNMLRRATGYSLAKRGEDTRSIQAYLGRRNISHTVRNTEMAPDRFKGFWRDEAKPTYEGGTPPHLTRPHWGRCPT